MFSENESCLGVGYDICISPCMFEEPFKSIYVQADYKVKIM